MNVEPKRFFNAYKLIHFEECNRALSSLNVKPAELDLVLQPLVSRSGLHPLLKVNALLVSNLTFYYEVSPV